MGKLSAEIKKKKKKKDKHVKSKMSQFENEIIFAADGNSLRISSRSKVQCIGFKGKCQLIKICHNQYRWVLTKEGVKKDREFTFIVSKDSDIKCEVANNGFFCITYRGNEMQMTGQLSDNIAKQLQQKIDEIKTSNLNHDTVILDETSNSESEDKAVLQKPFERNSSIEELSPNLISSTPGHSSKKRKCFTDQMSQQNEPDTTHNLLRNKENQKCNDQIFGELIVSSLSNLPESDLKEEVKNIVSSLSNLPESDTKEEVKISIQQLILQAKRNYNNSNNHQTTLFGVN